MKDWRLAQLEEQFPYLRGLRFRKIKYRAASAEWDHDHCAGCRAKFAEFDSATEVIYPEGYASCADHPRGAEYEWVCTECFTLFHDAMNWINATETG